MAPGLLRLGALALRASTTVCPANPSCPNDDSCALTFNGASVAVTCATDFYGGDLQLAQTSTLAGCMKACANTSGCVAASYVGQNCYMKSTLNSGVTNANVIGISVTSRTTTAASVTSQQITAPVTSQQICPSSYSCPGNDGCTFVGADQRSFQLSCGIDFYGGDYSTVWADSYQGCTVACANDPECVAASFTGGSAAGPCYLKKTKNSPTINGNVDGVSLGLVVQPAISSTSSSSSSTLISSSSLSPSSPGSSSSSSSTDSSSVTSSPTTISTSSSSSSSLIVSSSATSSSISSSATPSSTSTSTSSTTPTATSSTPSTTPTGVSCPNGSKFNIGVTNKAAKLYKGTTTIVYWPNQPGWNIAQSYSTTVTGTYFTMNAAGVPVVASDPTLQLASDNFASLGVLFMANAAQVTARTAAHNPASFVTSCTRDTTTTPNTLTCQQASTGNTKVVQCGGWQYFISTTAPNSQCYEVQLTIQNEVCL